LPYHFTSNALKARYKPFLAFSVALHLTHCKNFPKIAVILSFCHKALDAPAYGVQASPEQEKAISAPQRHYPKSGVWGVANKQHSEENSYPKPIPP
jgi:hypothetical protein